MTVEQGIFLFISFLILFSGFMMVTRSNLVHAALYLILVLFGVAVLFVLLNAGFLAVVQIIVYIGAIAILMIFAVMLTRGDVTGEAITMNSVFGWGMLLASLFGFALIIMLGQWPAVTSLAPALPTDWNELVEIGVAFLSPQGFVIPFEVASVLLLAALIGALYVARAPKKGE